jgi:predicted enzyme related to lactoylglutathione lyase
MKPILKVAIGFGLIIIVLAIWFYNNSNVSSKVAVNASKVLNDTIANTTAYAIQYVDTVHTNPVTHFEIPVTDMERAKDFYRIVFNLTFSTDTIDGYPMAMMPFYNNAMGISGALVKGTSYVPSKNGTRIYFQINDVKATIAVALKSGGTILYQPKVLPALGVVAEIQDTEGNRIGLFEPSRDAQ